MKDLESKIKNQLLLLEDKKNKAFVQKLIPTIDPERILWIKTPILRAFAKTFSKKEESWSYLQILPHFYFEENNLHAFLIEQMSDFNEALDMTEKFLPYIDNWATCDSFLPKVFKKNPEKLYQKIKIWLKSSHSYTIRYAIWLLLSVYLDENFQSEMVEEVSSVFSPEYYVQIMQAWYFATALAKQPSKVFSLLENKTLSRFIQNKTIQKARESKRISPEMKQKLLALKI